MKQLRWIQALPVMAVALTMLLGACSKSTPQAPVDERKNKLHEDPMRVEFVLQEGTLPAGTFAGSPEIKQFTPASSATQTIVLSSLKENNWNWAVDKNSPNAEFRVKSASTHPNTVYLLRIHYYNLEGKSMDYQFLTNNQNSIHQHFFVAYKTKEVNNGVGPFRPAELPYDYRYADTDPYTDDNGKYTGKTDPMGFKGFLSFVQDNTTFEMKIVLAHSFDAKYQKNVATDPNSGPKRDADGNIVYYPYYLVKSTNATTDINLPVRFVIGTGEKKLNVTN